MYFFQSSIIQSSKLLFIFLFLAPHKAYQATINSTWEIAGQEKDVEWSMSELIAENDLTTTNKPLTLDQLIHLRSNFPLESIGLEIEASSAYELCEEVDNDLKNHHEEGMKSNYILIPIEQDDPVNFDPACIKWISRPCKGKPSGPFDRQCSFWMPVKDKSSDECQPNYDDDNRRRKRMVFGGASIDGYDALSLCATIELFSSEGNTMFEYTALKTDVASELRCVTWTLDEDGNWNKDIMDPEGDCLEKNRFRINDLGISTEFLEDVSYSEDLACKAQGEYIQCAFFN